MLPACRWYSACRKASLRKHKHGSSISVAVASSHGAWTCLKWGCHKKASHRPCTAQHPGLDSPASIAGVAMMWGNLKDSREPSTRPGSAARDCHRMGDDVSLVHRLEHHR